MKKNWIFSLLVFVLIVTACSEQRQTYDAAPASAHKDEASLSGRFASGSLSSVSEEMALSSESGLEEEYPASPPPSEYISSSAALETRSDGRKFVRTAEVKFKSADAIRTTYRIEDLITAKGGHVESSSLRSETRYADTRAISKDSVLELVNYNLYADLVLRVPNYQLDTALKEIAQFVDHMDYRIITATDVSIQILQNQLDELRQRIHSQRIADRVEGNSVKSDKILDAELAKLNAQERMDQARLNQMILNDQIAYSAIRLTIYQEGLYKTNKYKVRPDLDRVEYKESFGEELLNALRSGWEVLLNILLFLARGWSVILILIVLAVMFRFFIVWLSRKINPTKK